jgi:hypothetical protein
VTQACAADSVSAGIKKSSDYRQFPCAWLFRASYSTLLFLGLIAIMLMLFHGTVGHIVGRWDIYGSYLHGWLSPGP